jgi:putative molybdopterin biosynthesis protein
MILDLIGDFMSLNYPGIHLSSTHIGSMGGLMALKRGEAHIAPTHLLEEAAGIYNIPYLERVFQEPMALIKGVKRVQGLLVKKGNPLNLLELSDVRKCRYVNRQRGSGTRVLFDYKLKQTGIEPAEIVGYDREAATHMAVAALVASDSADAGMGILAAANAMNLDFVELGQEEYDFAIPVKYLKLPEVEAFIQVLQSQELHQRLEELGGYQYEDAGQVIYLEEVRNEF